MQINNLTSILPNSTDTATGGLEADQGKTASETGVSTQIEDAVKSSGDSEGVSDHDTLAANRQGRGRLIDIKV